MKPGNGPHVKRRGWLKNGNPPGDPSRSPRCGARAKSTQKSCLAPAMRNGRCRLHGGKSTGPKTKEGLAKSRKSNWKGGNYSAESKREQRYFHELIAASKNILKTFK